MSVPLPEAVDVWSIEQGEILIRRDRPRFELIATRLAAEAWWLRVP